MPPEIAAMEDGCLTIRRGNGRGKVRLLTRASLDGRTQARKQFDAIVNAIVSDLGGQDQLSTVQLSLIEAFAGSALTVQHNNAKLLLGNAVDLLEHSAAISTLCRLASRIGTMHTAIERLRTSRLESTQSAAIFGAKEGRAQDDASYVVLRSLWRRRKSHPDEHPMAALKYAIDPDDEVEPQDLYSQCHLLIYTPTDEYAQAFVDSAVKLFEEVREEVERDQDDAK